MLQNNCVCIKKEGGDYMSGYCKDCGGQVCYCDDKKLLDVVGSITFDPIENPKHYTQFANCECIDITEQFNFCKGNAIKYIWRSGHKDDEIQDLRKAIWYLEREIKRLEG